MVATTIFGLGVTYAQSPADIYYTAEFKQFLNDFAADYDATGGVNAGLTAVELRDIVNDAPASQEFSTNQDLVDDGVLTAENIATTPELVILDTDSDLEFLTQLSFLMSGFQTKYGATIFDFTGLALIDGEPVQFGAGAVINNPATGVPIDGGLAFLAVAGIGVAVTRFRKQ